MSKPDDDRIAELKAKKDKINARIAKLQASAKAAERKREERRIRIVGKAALATLEKTPSLAFSLRAALRAHVEANPADRDLVADLIDSSPLPPAPKPEALGAGKPSQSGEPVPPLPPVPRVPSPVPRAAPQAGSDLDDVPRPPPLPSPHKEPSDASG